jgi:CBS domain-containing protein
MRGHVVGALPVLESGRLVGIVTDRDLALRVVATGQRPWETYVRQVMTPHPASCRTDDPLETALERMLARHVRRLVVLNGQSEVIGLLSVDDLVADDRTQPSALRVLRGSAPARGELDGELPDVT